MSGEHRRKSHYRCLRNEADPADGAELGVGGGERWVQFAIADLLFISAENK